MFDQLSHRAHRQGVVHREHVEGLHAKFDTQA